MSIAMLNSAPTPSPYFTSGPHFLETFCFSPKQPETQTHSDFKVYFLQRQTWLSLHTAKIPSSHIQRQPLLLAFHTLPTNQGPTYWPATPAAASFAHASYKPRTNILTSDTKGILSHSHSFTPAMIINLSLLCCLKRSFVIHLCCLIIYNVREINHFPKH